MRKTRAFIAVPAADEVETAALSAIDRLRSAEIGVKWVESDNLHWTVQFLGDIDDVEIHEVCKRTAAATAEIPPFSLTAHGVGAFPNRERPRTLWLGASEEPDSGRDAFCNLQSTIVRRLEPLGFRGEIRPFVPHVTLGRVSRDKQGAALLAARVAHLADLDGGSMWVDQAIVYASELTSQGPMYQVLARARLGG